MNTGINSPLNQKNSKKQISMIPFSPPRIDDKIIDEVVATLKSGWITTGPRTKLFEKKLQDYLECRRVVCLNSATAGLELMLRWYGVKEGDEVILPAYTYSATANVIMHCGAKPVFVDIGNDFNISVESIRAAITPRTKVIMPVDIGGYPCDYNAINALVRETGIRSLFHASHANQEKLGRILILADSAHSVGAKYYGRPTGSLTDLAVFSFHAVKNLTTAEGGAIALNLEDFDNEAIYRQLCIDSLHGQTKDALSKMQPGAWRYDIVTAGYKCNMTDIQAAIGLVELERYESDTLVKRKRIVEQYRKGFSDDSWAILPPGTDAERESCNHLFQLRIKNITEQQRDEIMQKIFDRQVSVNVHFIPVPMMSFYKDLGYSISDYPKAYSMYQNEISLPVYYDLEAGQVDKVISSVKESVHEIIGA
jgi:dTDP-4-amino-4,6-dideoxygalactose transaminase